MDSTIARYFHSPPDSLKAIGYVFIALYGLFVGVIGGLAVTFLQNGVRFADRRIKGIVSFVFAALFGAAAITLFVIGFRAA